MTLIELDDIKKNYKVIEIAVDFINPSYNVSRAKRLDTARYVICTLTENGIPRGVKDTEAARIRLQKPDRTYVYNDCDVLEDGRVFITLTEQILAVEGNAVCDIQLVDEETGIIYSTKNFIINIDKTAVDNSVMASTNEFDALNKLIATNKKINDELKANEEIRQANEFERIENETCREENEADRQNDEAERVNAENTRSINENQRIENEDIRKSNEAVRQDNETNRQINSNVAVLNAEKATEKANDAANNLQNKLDSHYFVLSEDKGIANGIAELDSNGLILSRQLPSYVDDVIEGFLYNNKFYKETEHITEIIGETGKIYVDLDSNKTYRWSGSSFTVISETIALGETSSTAYRGDRGKIAYEHSQASHAPSDAEVNQNTFSNVVVGNSAITANSKTDTLTLVEGNNITLIPDAINNKITISSSNEALGSSTVGSSTTPIYLNNGVPTVCEDINNAIEEAKNIALGRATGHVFDTVEDMVEWCSNNNDILNQGDNLYIRDVGVPDYWWDGTNYCQLETQKVDLTEYATKNELENKLNKAGDTMTGILNTRSILPSADKTYSLGDETNRYTRLYSAAIELYNSTTPFIDFHFNNSTEDYTSRIIESSSGTLTVSKNLTVNGTLTAKIWNGGSGGGLLQSTSVSFGNKTINPNESSTITQTYTIPNGYSAIGIIGVNSASTGLVLVRYGVAGDTVTLVLRNVTTSSITANPTALVLLARNSI